MIELFVIHHLDNKMRGQAYNKQTYFQSEESVHRLINKVIEIKID
jgi:hypothetical protein